MRRLQPSLAVVVVGAGLVLGAGYLPAQVNVAQGGYPDPLARAQAEPVTQTQVVCPGPEALGIEGSRSSTRQTVLVKAVAAPLASLPSGFAVGRGAGSLTMSGLPASGEWAAPVALRGQVLLSQNSAARSTLVNGVSAMAPGTVATQWSWTKTGQRRGLVTVACMPSATSSWLIAGGPAPGRLETLVLTNPGPNPVTVDVTVLGVKGAIESPNGLDLVVAGYGRRVVLLDAIAAGERSPVVHVVAQGGEVTAVLSDSWLDGVVPRGGDDAVSVVAPAREQVIAGVPIDGRALLRIGVPGDDEAVVESRVLTPSGPRTLPTDGVTRVLGHGSRDIDLGSLTPGAYAVQVRSDVPVVAAVMVDRRRTRGAPSDLAWSVASLPIRALSGLALPAPGVPGIAHRLDLAATSDAASVLVTTVGAGGRVSTKKVACGADSVSTLSLDGATSVWVTPLSGLVRAAVLSTVTDVGGVLLSLTPMVDLTLTTTAVSVRELRD